LFEGPALHDARQVPASPGPAQFQFLPDITFDEETPTHAQAPAGTAAMRQRDSLETHSMPTIRGASMHARGHGLRA
jgi:hypothetical protein